MTSCSLWPKVNGVALKPFPQRRLTRLVSIISFGFRVSESWATDRRDDLRSGGAGNKNRKYVTCLKWQTSSGVLLPLRQSSTLGQRTTKFSNLNLHLFCFRLFGCLFQEPLGCQKCFRSPNLTVFSRSGVSLGRLTHVVVCPPNVLSFIFLKSLSVGPEFFSRRSSLGTWR